MRIEKLKDERPVKRLSRFAKYKKTLALLTMVAPGAIWLLLLRYLPMGGIVLAFKNYKVYPRNPTFISNLTHSAWVKFDNFKFLFMTNDAWIMIRNTLLYNLAFIILGVIIPVAFAIIMNELTKKYVAKVYQTFMFFPYFLSWIVVSYFLSAFIDPQYGLIPSAQAAAGQQVTNWYTTVKPWPYLLIFAAMWKNVGYSTVLYLAAIASIDTNQYEAAALDGATKWQQIWHVTIPGIRSMIAILFIINIGKIFNADFGLFYNLPMQNGALFRVTQVTDTFIYRAMLNTGSLGMSTAAGLLQNVIGFVCILIANSIVTKIDSDSSLF